MRWMVLGASPSAPDNYRRPDVDIVAAAGDSIQLCRPDYYFIGEERSLDLYVEERAAARAAGTKVVVAEPLLKRLAERNIDFPHDEVIEYCPGNYMHAWRIWIPGRYARMCAGGLAFQWAANHGATEIHMVGMEGYTGQVDYFTGQHGNAKGPRMTEEAYGPLMQRVADKLPQVQFIMYGTPRYQFEGRNVSHG